MVLFHEDKKELTKGQKRRRLALRIVLILALLFCLSLWVLSFLGGPHEALKEGLEDFVSESTGMDAEIGQFDGFYFYPAVKFDASDIRLGNESNKNAITIERLEMHSSFWDIFFSRSKIRHLKMKNLVAEAGSILPGALNISEASILPETKYGSPGLIAEGTYGEHALNLFYELGMHKGHGDPTVYSLLDDKAQMRASLGDYKLIGTAGLYSGGGIRINMDQFGTAAHSLSGYMTLARHSRELVMEFSADSEKSSFWADIAHDDDGLTGEVEIKSLALDDLSGENSVINLISGFEDMLSISTGESKEGTIEFSDDMKIDLDVEIKKIMQNDSDIGSLAFPLRIENGVLKIEKIKGSVKDGKATGAIIFDTNSDNGDLTADFKIDDLKYGLENLEGRANFNVDLKSTGKSINTLKSNLKGTIVFVGGEGKLESRALQVWGGGVLNTMIPDFNPSTQTVMNCFVADFNVENGIATAAPFFVDTRDLTLVGDGTVNLIDETIDFTVKPKTKDISFIDTAVPVNISGALSDPAIRPSAFGLGKKIGGIFLQTINPAFFAINVAKWGLTDDHPCSKYTDQDIKAVLEDSEKPSALERKQEDVAPDEKYEDLEAAPRTKSNLNE
jgi:hypothetical protein